MLFAETNSAKQNKIMKKAKSFDRPAYRTGRQGFTLFELLVSISIIGILVALVSSSYSAAQKKARDSRRMQDMKSVQSAAEQYYAQNNYSYPGTTAPWTVGGQTILEVFPNDPKGGGGYAVRSIGATGYCFCANLENKTGNAKSTDASCVFTGIGGTGDSYCVKNQQ